MLEGKQETIYDWFDIQKELCSIMEIDEEYFRDYHEVVGGEYKDLWHVWCNNNEVNNDTIGRFWFDVMKNQSKEDWQIPFFKAIEQLQEQLGNPEYILIEYSW